MTMTAPDANPDPEPAPVWGGWDAAVRDDPFPLFASMRSACPVHRVRLADGHEAYVVLDHETARRALGDPRLSKDMLAGLAADPDVVAEGLPGPALARHMLAVDPPDHTRLRRLVARAFVPSRVAALEPRVVRIAEGLLDGLDAAGTGAAVDLVAGYAHPLPFQVIGELLGVAPDDRPALHDDLRTLLTPWVGDPPAGAVAASGRIVDYLGALIGAKRREPADDLASVLVTAAADGERLSEQELRSSLFQLIVAGHDTTTSLIGNAVVALLDHPDQLAALTGDLDDRLPAAVEELLRFCAAVPHATFRMTTGAVPLGGVEIPARRQVLVGLGAANRDPAAFPDPDRLDLTRPAGPHLAFGHGIHHCLGAALARLEARVALGALLRRHRHLALAVPRHQLAWTHGDGLVLRGLAALPVVLDPPRSHP
jgi:cytochrome P450